MGITPFYAEKLEGAKRWSRECSAKIVEEGLWQVTIGSGRVVAIDLRAKTCGCNGISHVFHAVMHWLQY
jgi:hypothetical protein